MMKRTLSTCALVLCLVVFGSASLVQAPRASEMNWRVESLLGRMSLQEKVGQLVIGFFRGPAFDDHLAEMIHEYRLGGVILYGITGNIEDPLQVANLIFDIQSQARTSGTLPLFVAIDQEGGLVNRINQGMTVFPGNMALGAAGDEALSGEAARIMARELRILGVNMNYAPVVDVNSEPSNPIIGIRSFGSDPELVARMGQATIEPYRAEQVIPTAKHFPGHGDTDIDSHYGLPLITRSLQELEEVELFPFQAMIEAGIPAMMSAHIEVPALDSTDALPATLSRVIIQGLLRDQMNFQGIIITDSLGMGALDQRFSLEERALLAFEAGCDILLFGADRQHEPEEQKEVIEALLSAVESGRITEDRIDESVRRILTAKLEANILKDPFPQYRAFHHLAEPGHLAVARHIAEKSLTLVRNTSGLLPLSGEPATVPILWPEQFREQMEILQESCPVLKPYFVPLDAPDEVTSPVIHEISDYPVIVTAGYDLYRRPAWQEMISLIPPNQVILLALRSPYDLLHYPEAGACILTYGDRPVSLEALGRFLSGDLDPQGKLPVDLPGLYERGWGLTSVIEKQ